MSTRLGRMMDWLFYGSGRSADRMSATDLQPSRHARPRVEDRARYDSGSAFFSR